MPEHRIPEDGMPEGKVPENKVPESRPSENETGGTRTGALGLWSPLTIPAANRLLHHGEYELRVERDHSRALRLVGSGTGVGVPLGNSPNWADLYGALVRLRRTRRSHDPGWLRHVTDLLDGKSTRPGGQLDWDRFPADELERLAAPNVPADEVWELSSLLTDGGHILLPPSEPPRSHTPSVSELSERGPNASAARALFTTGLNRTTARRRLHNSSRITTAVENDPQLRMHCAVRPEPIALVHRVTGKAVLTRLVEPAPKHPAYPGGTVVAGLAAMVRPRADGDPALLRHVIENRFERREDELDYFVEHLVRPLLRSFRTMLDTHRIGLFGLDEHGVGFELSPELQSTGRVVVTDSEQVRDAESVTSDEVRRGVEALVGTIEELIDAFTGIDFDSRPVPEDQVRAAVDRVTGEELRYLRERTAEILSCEQPLRYFAHTVPARQDEVLKEVLHAVQERARERRWNSRAPQPAVVIDLDLCGIVPLRRTLDAAGAVAGPRPGAPDGIPELADPGSLPVLPTYAESSWRTFVRASGLGEKYPEVDWRRVHEEFFREFARPWTKLRTDTVNAGLARFVWDVHDAGGRVVFCTGRRERVREYTREVLAAEGVPDAQLLCMPDDRERSISELKVERLRALKSGMDVVAVFDDMVENRVAITAEFLGARPVAVEVPGMATERDSDQPAADNAAVIATFETSPRTGRRNQAGSGLSYAHSLEELQVGALRPNRSAERWSVRLTESESESIVDTVLADTDRAADRTANNARAKFDLDIADGRRNGPPRPDRSESGDGPGRGDGPENVLRALHHVFTRKQFFKGARSHYQLPDMRRDAEPFVRKQEPIDVVLLGFPVKQCLNRLKATGPLPDFAELGGLTRLRELQRTVRGVYPPGLRFNILTDGRHFRPRPGSITGAYSRKLREYVDMVGLAADTRVEEIDAVATERIGPHLPAERGERIARYRLSLGQLLSRFDITEVPLRTLDKVSNYAAGLEGPWAPLVRLFPEMLMSVVYSVPLSTPSGVDRLGWATTVYADLYNLVDRTVPPDVLRARAGVLRRAWHAVVRYMAIMRVDEELGYDDLFPARVRLTVSAARPGRCGFTYLGASGLLPWQGTGVADPRGRLAIDFSASLLDQGFVPVYSPVLGPRQPWLMVPARHTRLHGRTLRLDEEFAERIRLRRK